MGSGNRLLRTSSNSKVIIGTQAIELIFGDYCCTLGTNCFVEVELYLFCPL